MCSNFEYFNVTVIVFVLTVSHAICKPYHSIEAVKVNDNGRLCALGRIQHKSS
jgi:hypothetical protein